MFSRKLKALGFHSPDTFDYKGLFKLSSIYSHFPTQLWNVRPTQAFFPDFQFMAPVYNVHVDVDAS